MSPRNAEVPLKRKGKKNAGVGMGQNQSRLTWARNCGLLGSSKVVPGPSWIFLGLGPFLEQKEPFVFFLAQKHLLAQESSFL